MELHTLITTALWNVILKWWPWTLSLLLRGITRAYLCTVLGPLQMVLVLCTLYPDACVYIVCACERVPTLSVFLGICLIFHHAYAYSVNDLTQITLDDPPTYFRLVESSGIVTLVAYFASPHTQTSSTYTVYQMVSGTHRFGAPSILEETAGFHDSTFAVAGVYRCCVCAWACECLEIACVCERVCV